MKIGEKIENIKICTILHTAIKSKKTTNNFTQLAKQLLSLKHSKLSVNSMQKNSNNKYNKNSKINIVSKQNKNPPKPNNKQIIATSKKHLKDKKPNNKTIKKRKGLKKQLKKIIVQINKNSNILGKIKVTNSLSLHKHETSLLSKQL